MCQDSVYSSRHFMLAIIGIATRIYYLMFFLMMFFNVFFSLSPLTGEYLADALKVFSNRSSGVSSSQNTDLESIAK